VTLFLSKGHCLVRHTLYARGALRLSSEESGDGNAAAGIGPYRHEINSQQRPDQRAKSDLRSTAFLRVYLLSQGNLIHDIS